MEAGERAGATPDDRFGIMADDLPVICWQADAAGQPTALNRRWDELCGPRGSEAGDRNVIILADAIRLHLEGAEAFSLNVALVGPDGTARPFLTHARPLLPSGWVGTCTSISDRIGERSQAFLLRLGDSIRDESNPEAILSLVSQAVGRELGADRIVYASVDWSDGMMHVRRDWRANGLPVSAHRFAMSVYSDDYIRTYSRGEAITAADVAVDPVPEPMRERCIAAGIRAFASVPLVKRGTWTAILAAQQFTPRIWTDAEIRLLAEVADRTWATLERARAAAALRESEQLFRTVTEAHPIPVVIAQDEGIVLANPAFYEMMGLPNGDAAAVSRANWSNEAGGWDGFVSFVRAHRRYDNHETKLMRGGSLFPVAVSWRHIFYKGRPAVISSIVDLSDRKRAEEELARSREALHQAEKLTALGSLLAGVSHELNNPLTIVTAQAALLEEEADGTALSVRAEKVRLAAERCSKIVRTFLAMARQHEPERRATDTAEIVAAALQLTEYSVRTAGIDVTLDVEPGLPPLFADPDQLHQVFVNLIVNAQQALQSRSGERRLSIRVASAGEGQVAVDVADNGPGVPVEIRRRVFEPFFTTKPEGVGTGVGLSFSLGLVEAHGGRLELIDGAGEGACFRVTLDAAPAVAAAAPAEAPAEPERPSLGTALIVDDEPDVAEVLEVLATRAGYSVHVARNGREAIERLTLRDYDVILSDLRMPELDGPALYEWIEREKPQLATRIAFVTGDTLGEAAARFLKKSARPVLEKPFSGKALRALLQTLSAED